MIPIGYGKEKIAFEVADTRLIGVLKPNAVEVTATGAAAVEDALDHPIGTPKLEEIVRAGQKVVIITSDITRPMPSKVVLPPVLQRLYRAGIAKSDITVVFALGSHRSHTPEEIERMVGAEIAAEIRCIDSDPEDVVHLGVTEEGTDVDIFRPVTEADVVVCLGNLEYHYFAGYSGGAKAVMPGVSTPRAIRQNHRMMVDERAYAGNVDSPVRRDVEDCIRFQPIDFIVNVVLDETKTVIKAVAGHYIEAHREGCRFLDRLYKIELDRQSDIVVVSAGGYPKDLNMYQAQKALDNAKHAVRPGGVIVWVAQCAEGFGSATFESWMTTKTPAQMIEEIKRDFKLGGHKAAAIALVLQKASIYFVSDIDPDTVRAMSLTPFASAEAAFAAATEVCGHDSTVYVMPYGGSTLPSFR